ncbi:MAG: mannose-1-phosphate guanylyltransferase, partial [Methanomicrobiales archaeon]|nr:mannose-1-phosphate guanylyltransferase [Methanomicrobiales archaeon]
MTRIHSIILAGGIGTRLWPLSRRYYPKQFLQLFNHSLFQMTYGRARLLSGDDGITVVTNSIHQYLVRNQLEEMGFVISGEKLLLEKTGKNTLPAVARAVGRLGKGEPEAVVAVFPSDHLLEDSVVEEVRGAAPLARDHLVTFGVRPARPHTGYGYIRPGEEIGNGYRVLEFREKPDEATAARLIGEGCLWNSGIFLFSVGCFLSELARYLPGVADAIASGRPDDEGIPSVSM